MFFAADGLIVCGMIAGLKRAAMDATAVGKATLPNMLTVDGGNSRPFQCTRRIPTHPPDVVLSRLMTGGINSCNYASQRW